MEELDKWFGDVWGSQLRVATVSGVVGPYMGRGVALATGTSGLST